MSADEEHPELAGWEPHEERPLRSRRRLRMLRVVVVLGVAGLVLPGVIITWGTAARTAEYACAFYASRDVPGASGSRATFELLGPEGPGWSCYAVRDGLDDFFVRALGLIPGPPQVDEPAPGQSS